MHRRSTRAGHLEPFRHFSWVWRRGDVQTASIQVEPKSDRVTLDYHARDIGDQWEPLNYDVHLERTACHLGSERSWFICPVVSCGRRVANLYEGHIFICRVCNNLAYASRSEDPCNRAMQCAERLRAKMNWVPGIGNGPCPRPSGIHHQTYSRLCREHEHWCRVSDERVLAKFRQHLI
jgi:hypothetical protein